MTVSIKKIDREFIFQKRHYKIYKRKNVRISIKLQHLLEISKGLSFSSF
ncbi:hypothetical protein LEP1GSC172_2196 [Leptospira noguchii]|uniref:Uncharacterized protein n=1 Tax=Leptospira noguchii TaxID=28182 RepID=M6VRF2_9LEPT|nr:hypothetical protein LEP1GSC172_2196 [Leptospira noguchii]